MKTIIYLLLFIFILGLIPFNQIAALNTTQIVVQAADTTISTDVLEQSAQIMTGRLKDFNAGVKQVLVIPEKRQIQITLSGKVDLKTMENLLIQQGKFEFREPGSDKIVLSGNDMDQMSLREDESGTVYLSVKFNESAIAVWAEVSKRNIGKPIAILLDGQVIFDPVVREEILNGDCSLSGNFTKDEVKYFVALGNNGELPVEFFIVK
jgi:preprotein translocase subunit SecD